MNCKHLNLLSSLTHSPHGGYLHQHHHKRRPIRSWNSCRRVKKSKAARMANHLLFLHLLGDDDVEEDKEDEDEEEDE